MRIRLITQYCGPKGSYPAGSVVEIEDVEAAGLVAGKYAEEVVEDSHHRDTEGTEGEGDPEEPRMATNEHEGDPEEEREGNPDPEEPRNTRNTLNGEEEREKGPEEGSGGTPGDYSTKAVEPREETAATKASKPKKKKGLFGKGKN